MHHWWANYDPDSIEKPQWTSMKHDSDGLVQERRNSSALALELCLPCTNPSIDSPPAVEYESFECSDPHSF